MDLQSGINSNKVNIDFKEEKLVENKFSVEIEPITIDINGITSHQVKIIPQEFKEHGDSNDYAELILTDIPEEIFINNITERVKLDTIRDINMDILCNLNSPGNYIISGFIRNIGNNNIYKNIEIPVLVNYSEISISSITPAVIEMKETPILTVRGEGFTDMTSVEIDGAPCIISSQKRGEIQIQLPQLTETNSGILSVNNPGYENTTFNIDIIKPYFKTNKLKHIDIINIGENANFYTGFDRFNEFIGDIGISILHTPENWKISYPDFIDSTSILEINVDIPLDTLPGRYIIQLYANDQLIEYVVEIVERTIEPHITALSKYTGNSGDIITIYGYGFNKISKLYIDREEADYLNLSNDKIEFIFPDQLKEGVIEVYNETFSNKAFIEYKRDNFSIYPSVTEYYLTPGDIVEQTIYIRGYADTVYIESGSDIEGIKTHFSNQLVELNGSTSLTITIDNSIDNGLYHLKIKGRNGSIEKSEIIRISVGDNISFTDNHCSPGRVDKEYLHKFDVKDNFNPVKYRLSGENFLPDGLVLNHDSGIISGYPERAGNFYFTIKASESLLRSCEQEFHILIEDNGWLLKEGADGNNRFSETNTPDDKKVKWKCDLSEVAYLLNSGDTIYAVNQNGISFLDKTTGYIRYRIEAENDNVYLENELLNIQLGDSIKRYNKNSGFYFDEISVEPDFISLIHSEDNRFKIDKNRVLKLYTDGFYELYTHRCNFNSFTTFNSEGHATDVFGNYLDLFNDKEINIGLSDGKLAVNDRFITIFNDNSFVMINRQNNSITRKNITIDELIMTRDKLLIVNSNGLHCLNIYSKELIWQLKGNFKGLITGGNELFLIEKNSKIISLGNVDSYTSPETSYSIYPPIPDGDNGYYVKYPKVVLSSYDRESFGEIKYKINGKEWLEYKSELDLFEGDHKLEFFSSDSDGIIEKVKSLNIKVDSNPPVTEYKIATENDSFILKLIAIDEISGVKNTYYSYKDSEYKYNNPITLNKEDMSYVEWWSIDNAGNKEKRNSLKQPETVSLVTENTPPIIRVEDNPSKSEIQCKISPEKPDGANGYYVTIPSIKLYPDDLQSISGLTYSINGEAPQEYSDEFSAVEGDNNINFYFKDQEFNFNIKVDTIPPESKLSRIEKNGIITFFIESTDLVYSTINGITTEYREPVLIDSEGLFDIEFFSMDSAGNVEDIFSDTILNDIYYPESSHILDTENLKLELSAVDSFSGISRIEYIINDNSITTYTEPLNFNRERLNLIRYRAVDNSNKVEEWNSLTVDFRIKEYNSILTDYRSIPLKKGPDYLIGLESITGVDELKFSLPYKCYIFLISSTDSEKDETWELIEQNKDNKVYYKTVEKDKEVELILKDETLVLRRHPVADFDFYFPAPDIVSSTGFENEISRNWFYRYNDSEWINGGEEIFTHIPSFLTHNNELEIQLEVKIESLFSKNQTETITVQTIIK